MTPRRVLLLRHGRTEWNAAGRFQGQADPPLDDIGRRQAAEAASLIAAMEPDLLVTSDLKRAVQTADALQMITGMEARPEPRLRERGLGHWEGLTRDELAQRYPDELADWTAGRDVTRRGGETREEVATRACAAFADLPACELAVLVSHSATAVALTSALLRLDQTVHILGPLANCHWSELALEQSGWRLRAHNAGAARPVGPIPVVEAESPDAVVLDAEA